MAAIAVGAALRLRDVGGRSMWVDELFSVGLAAQDVRTLLAVLYGEEANQTLYYLVMFGWSRLVGPTADEFWMRLPSVVFGLAVLPVMYTLGARLGSRWAGLAAALLVAVNVYHAEMSEEARAYSLWALCTALSWLALLGALQDGRRRAWASYAIWTALSFYAHFFTVFFVAAHTLVIAIRWRWTEVRAFVTSGVAAGLLCLPFAPFFLVNDDGSQILHVRRSDLGDLFTLFRLYAGATLPLLASQAALGLLATGIGVVGAVRLRSRDRLSLVLAPLLWLLVPVLLVFTLSYVKPMFRERYLFAAMPALPLLAALGIAALRPRLLGVSVFVGIVALLVWSAVSGLEVRQSENWRGAVSYLVGQMREDDGLIFISKRGQLGYEYYGGWLGGGQPHTPRSEILEPFDWIDLAESVGYYRALESGTSRLPEFSARHPRIWLVLSHEYDSTFEGDTSEAVREWLIRRGYAARQRTFQNIRVLLYERRA
ncbi:MAG: glycosyltransferase family 39 protein [Chloroflexi bacterium]|nr:glycosyltransferase family 39 protein [Chloroflexota bacterium]